jgi:hypothetical protein
VFLELVCAAALAAFAWTHTTTLEVLYVVAALLGVARAFAGPALGALAPNLVPVKILPNAIALSSIAWQSGAIIGPALGGYLYALAPEAPYIGSAILCAVSLFGLFRIPELERATSSKAAQPWQQMVEGLRYVRQNRLVLGAISLDLFAVLLGGATAMLPVYARDILHAGPEGLGHLRAAPALGATLTAAFFAVRPLKSEVGVKMLLAVAVFGGATIVFGLSRSMPLSLVCLALLGVTCLLRHPDLFTVSVFSNPLVPLALILILDGLAAVGLHWQDRLELTPHFVSRALSIYLAGVGLLWTLFGLSSIVNVEASDPVVGVAVCAGIAMAAQVAISSPPLAVVNAFVATGASAFFSPSPLVPIGVAILSFFLVAYSVAAARTNIAAGRRRLNLDA